MEEFNLLNHVRGTERESVVIWMLNIGIEKFWGQDVSSVKSVADEITVNHVEEMNLLITRKQDYLILRKLPDPVFLELLRGKGIEIPNFLIPSREDESVGIAQLVQSDERLLEELRRIKRSHSKVYFVPYGVSELEEWIAENTGIELIGGSNKLSQKINNKIFARDLAAKLAFPVAEGEICHSLEEVHAKAAGLLVKYGKIVIKYPTGASGKGLWVVENDKKLFTTVKILERLCHKKNIPEEFVVERWYEKQRDFNYQIYVGKDGTIEVFSIKEQLLNETVYVGSLIKPRLQPDELAQCEQYGIRIGQYLRDIGYNGVLGVDAMITKDGEMIPVIEVNARFTLSTYVSFLPVGMEGGQALAFYHRIPLQENDGYEAVQKRLQEEIDEDHFVCYVSETIREKTVGGHGRLFVLLFEKDTEAVLALYDKTIDLLERLEMR